MEDVENGKIRGIGGWMDDAWKATHGAKWGIQKALLLFALVMIPVYIVLQLVPQMLIGGGSVSPGLAGGVMLVGQLLVYLVMNPINVAFVIIGAERDAGQDIDTRFLWKYFPQAPLLLGVYILMMIFIMIGFILLILPGLYLAVAYSFAMPLAADKKMGLWEAMETSRKTVSKHWFSVFGLFLLMALVNAVAAIPLGIGLIWSVPWSVIAMGAVYRDLFGYEPEQPVGLESDEAMSV